MPDSPYASDDLRAIDIAEDQVLGTYNPGQLPPSSPAAFESGYDAAVAEHQARAESFLRARGLID